MGGMIALRSSSDRLTVEFDRSRIKVLRSQIPEVLIIKGFGSIAGIYIAFVSLSPLGLDDEAIDGPFNWNNIAKTSTPRALKFIVCIPNHIEPLSSKWMLPGCAIVSFE
jgi:hypothetical protein